MSDLVQIHKDITHEVKELIEPMAIVFPAQYGKLYMQVSQEQSIELKPEQLFDSEMLDDKIIRHIVTLHECADEALEAMDKEDKRLLKMAILRTKQLQEEIHELHKLVYEDSLTKSYNRKWLEDNIIDSNKLNVRDSGTLVVVDLNKFKEINDTYGHIIGDKVLFTIAKQLRETKGRVVRYGGDEFIIIFDKGLSTSDITKELESVLKYLQKVSFQIKDRKPFKVDFAYGMAPFDNNSKIDQVIEATDKAMYLNKKHKHFFQNEKR